MKGTTSKVALTAISMLALGGGMPDSRMVEATAALADVHATCATAATTMPRLPLQFEINRGQHPAEVTFAARGRGYGILLTSTGAVLTMTAPAVSGGPAMSGAAAMRMTFAGANPAPRVSGLDALPGKANYIRGRDPRAWRTNIPTYARVASREIYPGIDLVFYGNQQQLEYDLVLAPHADPTRIALTFEGVERVELTPEGELLLRVPGATAGAAIELRQRKPVIYQQIGGARQAVAGQYVRRGAREVGIALGPYDRTRTLVIDPVVAFSSYLGGTRSDTGQGIAVDTRGNLYLTGRTTSLDFPVTTGASLASDLEDVFISKISADGSTLVYSTYLGGADSDFGEDVAVDTAGRAYLTGFTRSTDFPVADAVQPTFAGGNFDAFVAKLSAGGDALLFSTYLGGSKSDQSVSIALDANANAYITGSTGSANFPVTPKAFQPTLADFEIDFGHDCFVTKLTPAGTLAYSTYLGGDKGDDAFAIAVNAAGNAFVVGITDSIFFPKVNAFYPRAFLGIVDAFVTKLSRDGSSVVYSTNFGGDRIEVPSDVTVDASDRATVVGRTTSTDFVTFRPLRAALAGEFDAFITTIAPAGSTLVFSTYFGGTATEGVTSVAAHPAGHIFVTGGTVSSDFPVANPSQVANAGNGDAFVAELDVQTAALVYSTYLGGEGGDGGGAIALDPAGSAYVIGSTSSTAFPVVNGLQSTLAGELDVFFAKITNFDVCLRDDQTGLTLRFNTSTGGYQLGTCAGNTAPQLLGTGRVRRAGDRLVLFDARVIVSYNVSTNTGSARIVLPDGALVVITDRDATNRTCACE
jgi:hypothetical protein